MWFSLHFFICLLLLYTHSNPNKNIIKKRIKTSIKHLILRKRSLKQKFSKIEFFFLSAWQPKLELCWRKTVDLISFWISTIRSFLPAKKNYIHNSVESRLSNLWKISERWKFYMNTSTHRGQSFSIQIWMAMCKCVSQLLVFQQTFEEIYSK